MESFADRIRQLRMEKGEPLRTVAAYLDIDQAILSKMERGQRRASRQQVVQLAKYFGVKEEELLVAWLSDKIVYEMGDEELILKAMQVAEEKIAYKKYVKPDRQAVIRTIKNYLKKDKYVTKAWIFGSFARGDDGPSSDIDLMIEVSENSRFSLYEMADIQFNLEQLLNKKIDLVEKGAIKPFAWETAKHDLKLVYEKDVPNQ